MENARENALNKRIKKFAEIVAENSPNESSSKIINSSWCRTFFSAEIQTFIFKKINNVLGIGARVAHYNNIKTLHVLFV
jgi:hypothetical protein